MRLESLLLISSWSYGHDMNLLQECSCGHLDVISTLARGIVCESCGARDRWSPPTLRRAVHHLAELEQSADLAVDTSVIDSISNRRPDVCRERSTGPVAMALN